MPELTGLDRVYIWLTDAKANLDTSHTTEMGSDSLFKINLISSKGATAYNIQNLSPSNTTVYGSDSVAEHLVGTAAPTIEVGANDIPFEVSSLLMGMKADDTNGGYAMKGHADQVLGGAIGVTHWGTDEAFICFPFGLWTQNGGVNLGTNQQSPTVARDRFQLAAQARPTDDLLMQMYLSNQKGFSEDKMLKYIINGYVGSNSESTKPAQPTSTDDKKNDPGK